jgi:hypothetical protein
VRSGSREGDSPVPRSVAGSTLLVPVASESRHEPHRTR